MIGAEVARKRNTSDDPIKHPAHGDAVQIACVRGEADDPAGELIHDNHDPMASERDGLAPKEIHTP
jgi:hypothetical protein